MDSILCQKNPRTDLPQELQSILTTHLIFQSIITSFFTYSNNDPTFEFTLSLFLLFLMPLKCIFFILLCTDDRRLKDLFINLLNFQKTQIQKKANCTIFKAHLLQKTQITVMHYFTRFILNLSIHPFGYHGAIFYTVLDTKLFIAVFLKLASPTGNGLCMFWSTSTRTPCI